MKTVSSVIVGSGVIASLKSPRPSGRVAVAGSSRRSIGKKGGRYCRIVARLIIGEFRDVLELVEFIQLPENALEVA
jgi:hypothetical protein